jgi:uncharacterized protein with PQ loop repeat
LSEFASCVGGIAAFLASLSNQVRKAWPRGSAGDLSLAMLAAFTLGHSLGVVYELLRHDWVICANAIGAALAGIVLGRKIRNL